MNKIIPATLVEGDEGTLYARQPKVYPREIDGRFQRLRYAALFWLLGMFYLFPWLRWGDHQAVLFDLPARKFYIFGLTFWPQDFFFMTWLLVMAGLSLFFFTAVAGRLWCGYACPQTVWTEVFLWIERWIEGDRNRRIKLDHGPWNRNKIVRKSAKQFVWITFALWTGLTFVGFFTPIRELSGAVLRLELGGWETFWILFYALATYGNAGYLREQVCKYMCPYARFQGAMFDRDTLIISYDEARGEPRGGRRRGTPSVLAAAANRESQIENGKSAIAARAASHEATRTALAAADPAVPAAAHDSRFAIGELRDSGAATAPLLGDCIDCLACVQVCPTGIDIRNGLQVGCIACAACIDACDAIMDKMDYPRGLIRYTTENALSGKPSRVLRVRTLIYATVLLALFAGFVWSVGHRAMLLAEVIRDRNALWRPGPAGSIENGYTIKLVNKSDDELELRIRVAAPATLQLVGDDEVELGAGSVASIPLTLRAPAGSAHGREDVTLELVPREREHHDDEHHDDEHRDGQRAAAPVARVVTRFFAPEAP